LSIPLAISVERKRDKPAGFIYLITPCLRAGHNRIAKSVWRAGDKVMRHPSIVADLVIMIALGVTTNAQNHSSIGYVTSSANDRSENQTPQKREYAATVPSQVQPARSPFSLAKIDSQVVKEFQRAWQISRRGYSNIEGLVLLFANPDGSYRAQTPGQTNECRKVTFRWYPEIIAIVHTHPRGEKPEPSRGDIGLADRFGVPVITITFAGMFMYDPGAKKISKIKDGLDWLDPLHWTQQQNIEGTVHESTSHPEGNKPLFDLTRIKGEVVKEFKKAWSCSGNGYESIEGAVLLFRVSKEAYQARFLGCSQDDNKFSFKWNPSAIAIVHTHPNSQEARPSEPDIRIAERFNVPIFTLTNRGMFMYHPATKKISKVMERLNWLNPSNWRQKPSLNN
jgi:proteasome lid subunit RPN8/RPN11